MTNARGMLFAIFESTYILFDGGLGSFHLLLEFLGLFCLELLSLKCFFLLLLAFHLGLGGHLFLVKLLLAEHFLLKLEFIFSLLFFKVSLLLLLPDGLSLFVCKPALGQYGPLCRQSLGTLDDLAKTFEHGLHIGPYHGACLSCLLLFGHDDLFYN